MELKITRSISCWLWFKCCRGTSRTSTSHNTFGFGINLFTFHLCRLVSSLLCTHGLHHFLNVACNHISFLLFCCQRAFSTLQSLFAVFLFLGCIFWIFPYCSIICVFEVDTKLFWGYVCWCLYTHFFLFFQQDTLNCFLYSFSSCCFIVFIFTILFKWHNFLFKEIKLTTTTIF